MKTKCRAKLITALTLFVGLALGFLAGYRFLPNSPLAQSPAFIGSLLYGSLPYALALADEPAAPVLAAKAEPRLIIINGEAIEAWARLNKAAAEPAPIQTQDEPRILVYCTHSSEEYLGQKRIAGARGGIHTVAERLSQSLNAAGLPAVYCDTIHDYPDWDLSYASSLASIQKMQQQYPGLEIFIDVHRDSLANSVLATSSGQVARIMLVVGSDARLAHPNWQSNKAFSHSIQEALEAQTPGITRSVNVQQGRYNQHVSAKAILVEMGSTANTVQEACASADLLAAALAKILL